MRSHQEEKGGPLKYQRAPSGGGGGWAITKVSLLRLVIRSRWSVFPPAEEAGEGRGDGCRRQWEGPDRIGATEVLYVCKVQQAKGARRGGGGATRQGGWDEQQVTVERGDGGALPPSGGGGVPEDQVILIVSNILVYPP